jgi:hypothetical protein
LIDYLGGHGEFSLGGGSASAVAGTATRRASPPPKKTELACIIAFHGGFSLHHAEHRRQGEQIDSFYQNGLLTSMVSDVFAGRPPSETFDLCLQIPWNSFFNRPAHKFRRGTDFSMAYGSSGRALPRAVKRRALFGPVPAARPKRGTGRRNMSLNTECSIAAVNRREVREAIDRLLGMATVADQTERRSEPRYPFFQPVIITFDHGLVRQVPAFLREISAVGMGLLHAMPLEPGRVEFALTNNREPQFTIPADIRWCRACGEGWYVSGGTFVV